MGLLSSPFSFSSSFPSLSLLLPRSRPDSKPEPHSVIEMRQEDGSKKKGRGMLVRLVSSAGTGYFYVAKKNKKGTVEKLELRKYDPVVRRHVLFTEGKMIK